uniref:EGF-like domain-containing protein n=1 Tax=Bursaphelenchus xylophilus TaxID=6326 RepID=A0A1I7S380_BURXY
MLTEVIIPPKILVMSRLSSFLIFLFILSARGATIPASWTPCAQNICKNGGSCYDDAGAQFCTCASGFGGELCERTLEQPHIESDDGRIASLSLACWILALSFCLSLCFGIMGWIFYRKERHDSKELREEVKRLQNELKMQTSKHNLITKRIRTKPEERKLLSKEVP